MPKRLSRNVCGKILELRGQGHSPLQVATLLDMNYSTVWRIVHRYEDAAALKADFESHHQAILNRLQQTPFDDYHQAYAYLLGMYLGDGHIVTVRHTHRLAIWLDDKYPNVVDERVRVIQIVFWENKVGVHQKKGCRMVNTYSE